MLSVHPNGFYAWLKRPLCERALKDNRQVGLLKKAWEESGKVYGYRKLHDDLQDQGETCCPNSVARLARMEGIKAQIDYRRRSGTCGGKPSTAVNNTLDRQFDVTVTDTAWVTGITYIKTTEGFAYLACVRVVMLMVDGVWAAIGITTANLLLVSGQFGRANFAHFAANAVTGGFAPDVSLRATMILLKADKNLKNITAKNLHTISVGTAIGSSVLQNVVFCLIGVDLWKDILTITSAMALGDFTGTLVVLLVAWGGLAFYQRIESRLR